MIIKVLRKWFVFLSLSSLCLASCASSVNSPVETMTPTSASSTIVADTPTSQTTTIAPFEITPVISETLPVVISPTELPVPSTTPTSISTTTTPSTVSTLPDSSKFQWKVVTTGLTHPVTLANAGDGSGRLFVLEQPGTIRIVKDSQLLKTPFLDIRDRVGSNGSERGLLGIAFHPGFKSNGLFYVNYTDRNGNTHIARFNAGSDPNQADPASEKNILTVNQPYANHNGGNLVFGPDGYLYIGMGDGGSQGDPKGNGQSLQTLLGKLLRIDIDHGDPYSIPPDNPLAKSGGKPEIFAYGLRNPWRFSFDSRTGDLYIADVGQDKYEEIDIIPAGTITVTNFGWNIREGLHPYSGAPYNGKIPLTGPVFEYDHSQGCAVIGGFVYRGASLPEMNGIYFLADNCSGLVWGLLKTGSQWQHGQLFSTKLNITSFGLDENGELYMLAYDGRIFRLDHS